MNRKAKYWLEAGVKQGSENAKGILGQMYYEGRGVEQNFERAFELLRDAARVQPFAWEQFLVATMYFEGKGVARDLKSALELSNRAISNVRNEDTKRDFIALRVRIEEQLAASS